MVVGVLVMVSVFGSEEGVRGMGAGVLGKVCVFWNVCGCSG